MKFIHNALWISISVSFYHEKVFFLLTLFWNVYHKLRSDKHVSSCPFRFLLRSVNPIACNALLLCFDWDITPSVSFYFWWITILKKKIFVKCKMLLKTSITILFYWKDIQHLPPLILIEKYTSYIIILKNYKV